jgi:hypothetical protein
MKEDETQSPSTSLAEPGSVYSGNVKQLCDDIDKGWRYFWRKRGFIEPPPLVDEGFKFGNMNFEKKPTKKSK